MLELLLIEVDLHLCDSRFILVFPRSLMKLLYYTGAETAPNAFCACAMTKVSRTPHMPDTARKFQLWFNKRKPFRDLGRLGGVFLSMITGMTPVTISMIA